jgi:exonuclease III
MDVISWNIQWGGGSRLDAIASVLEDRSPDVIVLGEYVRGATEPLIKRLARSGWCYEALSDPPERRGGVAIVSRIPLEQRPTPEAMTERFRYIGVGVPAVGLELRGIYAPLQGDPYGEFWEALLASLSDETDSPVLLVGDLNACHPGVDTPARSLFSARYFKRLPAAGYVDLWRAGNDSTAEMCTWEGRTHPYRLDHAFGTPALAGRVVSCSYDHTVRERGLSDHSLLTVRVDCD